MSVTRMNRFSHDEHVAHMGYVCNGFMTHFLVLNLSLYSCTLCKEKSSNKGKEARQFFN